MLKVAVIGCGCIGEYHLEHLLQFTDIIELVGFCDIIPERAEAFSEKAGTNNFFADFKEMYDKTSPDAVFICVPPYCHGEIEFETISRGIHFFVEKPISLDLDLAREIRDRAKAANLITAVGFQCRYDTLAPQIKKFVTNNPIPYIDCTRFGGVPSAPWWTTKALSGGQLVEQTIHQLDYIRYVIGEPDTVFSMAARGFITDVPEFDTDDVTATVVKFKNGTIATIVTGCYPKSGDAFDSKTTFSSLDKRGDMALLSSFKVYGENPQEENAVGDLVIKGDGGLSATSDNAVVYKNVGDPGVTCDRTFLEAVISGDGSKILSPYEDGFRSVAFGLAANESMETGKAVKVAME